MARPLRIEFPGAFYHVMNRGNTGMNIYRSKRDREKFLEYVGEAVKRYGIKVHTFCLMTTHYHFLIETPHANLSQAIKWINVGYAVYFNRKRRRFGHLFQGRFKAVLVDADEYLKQLSRYIHLNPVRARMVEHCRDYPWSSYRALSGYAASPEWLETDWLLSLFGEDRGTAKKRYRNFVELVENGKIENPSDDVVGGVVLGRDDFVNWVKKTFLSKDSNSKEIPQLKILKPRPTPDDLIQAVSNEFGCGMESILQKGKKGNLARDVAIYLCRELTGETSVSLGRRFDISGAGIAARHDRIAKKLEADRNLKGRDDRIRRKILDS
jgi:REP element-mobilizing transposase RayT